MFFQIQDIKRHFIILGEIIVLTHGSRSAHADCWMHVKFPHVSNGFFFCNNIIVNGYTKIVINTANQTYKSMYV